MAKRVTIQATLHPAQDRIASSGARYNVLACGRRWGKTTLALVLATETLARGRSVGWFAPTYRMLSDSWREVCDRLASLTLRARQDEHRLEIAGGGELDMWSLDAADTARGRRYARVIVDEAAQAPGLQHAWENVIRPTLTDFRGDAWFMSTPAGMGYFWQLWQRGEDPAEPEWRSWQQPSSSNPLLPAGEIEAARRELPEQVFAQEYLAQFIEDSGLVFRNVLAAQTATRQDFAEGGHTHSVGLDWGKLNDFTVISVVDISSREQVYLDRFNRIDYEFQSARVLAALDRFPGAYVVAESNSVGEPLIDRLRRDGVRVQSYAMTQGSKSQLIEDLALAFERAELAILPDRVQSGELLAYGQERLPSGAYRYGAPGGMHDDCVMALALAWHGASKIPPDAQPGHDRFAALHEPAPPMVDLARVAGGLRFTRRQRGGNRADVLRSMR